jgi:NAD-reducing hydrogenase large subunit
MDYIGEASEPDSYLKSPYFLSHGYPNGMYRVGPLARLNIVNKCGTPRADEAFSRFKALATGPVLSSFHFHFARLVEIIYGIERIEELLRMDDILSPHVRATGSVNSFEGIGCSEAPRGTLTHHYKVDENGQMLWANLIIATGHNNLAMNKGVLQTAKKFVRGDKIPEGMLNRVEAVIRTFDPCLSCSTHAFGHMPLKLQLLSPDGTLIDELRRDK